MIGFSQQDQYTVMHGLLNERQWRLYVATEAKRRGRGAISQVAREAGVTRKTIRKGLQEVEAGELYEPGGRIRRRGGGRKQITAKDETLRADRGAQFQQINRNGKAFEAAGKAMICVDCKKKEVIGNFKNNGREWQAKGQDTTVNVYDYRSIADGKAVPYGIYDVVHN